LALISNKTKEYTMFSGSHAMSRGPLAPWVQHPGREMSRSFQQGGDQFMHAMHDVEHMMEQNAAMVCIGGLILGTFVDRRFLLLPLALGGIKLWKSLQSQ
jgi:hypothetical protein